MKEDYWTALAALLLLVLLAWVAIAALTSTGAIIPKAESQRLCIQAGYERVEFLAGELQCVGVRDGNSAVEPLADVRARLEGE